MPRIIKALLVGLTLASATWVAAADDPPAGDLYKLTFNNTKGIPQTLWLVRLGNKGGKWTGEVVATREDLNVPPSTLEDLTVKDGQLQFKVRLGKETTLTFEGRAPVEGAKRIHGVIVQGGVTPAELERTAMTSFTDAAGQALDILDDPRAGALEQSESLEVLLASAAERQARPEDVRAWAGRAIKLGETFGPRWQKEIIRRIATVLVAQEKYPAIALEYARKAERNLDPREKPVLQKRTLEALAKALRQNKKEDEAKDVDTRVGHLDLSVKPTPFAGRKPGSDRTLLVELFTGAQCPPCVASDVAFDALEKTYKPSDVVLLQYHLHVPGSDPLTNPDTEARAEYYNEFVEGTPTLLLNGRPTGIGGGTADMAADRYEELREAIEPSLEGKAKVKLTASASRKGDKIAVTAEVADAQQPGPPLKLRLALVEQVVAYKGSNGQTTHDRVVRALPGGAAGLPIKDETLKKEFSIDVTQVRKNLEKYLDDFAKAGKEEGGLPNKERPLELKKLSVVAFVQNDQTKEVLQALEVPVKAE